VLELAGVTAGYGSATVLRNVSFSVPRATVTAVLGANGAGKTTTLRVAAGLISPKAGQVRLSGVVVNRLPPHRRTRAGFCLIPEGRGIFPNLTVTENLRLQVPPRRPNSIDEALDTFPILRERRNQMAGTMSGGQQQLLAIARAFLAKPDVVALDEVSMGLAPKAVDEIFDSLRALAATGVALVVVEQYVDRALAIADQVVLMDRGTTSFVGPVGDVDPAEIVRSYLGVGEQAGVADEPR
jgi:branched-chain amino acid transport system ATP-binding protein